MNRAGWVYCVLTELSLGVFEAKLLDRIAERLALQMRVSSGNRSNSAPPIPLICEPCPGNKKIRVSLLCIPALDVAMLTRKADFRRQTPLAGGRSRMQASGPGRFCVDPRRIGQGATGRRPRVLLSQILFELAQIGRRLPKGVITA